MDKNSQEYEDHLTKGMMRRAKEKSRAVRMTKHVLGESKNRTNALRKLPVRDNNMKRIPVKDLSEKNN